MRFKFLIATLCVLMFAGAASAGNKFVYGGSYRGVIHADNTLEHAYGNALGVSFTTEAPFFAVPDETFLVYNYTRSEIPDTNLSAGFHDAQIRGVWYFNDSTSTRKFNPYFLAGIAYQAETAPDGFAANDEFGGDFGLGFGYKVKPKWGLWAAATARVATEIFVNVGTGLYFEFGK